MLFGWAVSVVFCVVSNVFTLAETFETCVGDSTGFDVTLTVWAADDD